MKETIENLWDEYLYSTVEIDKDGQLTKKILDLNEKAMALLNDEQRTAVEAYVDAIYDIETVLIKKAFVKGCEFTASFLLEAGDLKKQKER